MPAPGIILAGVLIVAGYYYVGKPVAHAVKKAAHGVVHVVTLGKK